MLWIISVLAFFLSATLDNLASTIVLVSLLRRLIPNKEERIWFVCLAVIGANAGGAWSPIGDVTTTMLWIGNKVTTPKLILYILIPSIISMLVPVFLATLLAAFKGDITNELDESEDNTHKYGAPMLCIGLSAVIFVPVFKTLLKNLSVVWFKDPCQ